MIMIGMLSAFALYIFLLKLPANIRRKLLGFDLPIDVAVTALLMVLFAGTYSGMVAAIFGGLIFSGLLIVSKSLFGYERLVWLNKRAIWLPVPPIWRR